MQDVSEEDELIYKQNELVLAKNQELLKASEEAAAKFAALMAEFNERAAADQAALELAQPKIITVIHHHKETGHISAAINCNASAHGDGIVSSYADHEIIKFDECITIDHSLHKIDVATKKIIEKPSHELKAEGEQRLMHAVKTIRQNELLQTDYVDAAPHLDAVTRAKWQAYRQALRDITKAGDATAMTKAWPLRPDGTDAIAALRQIHA